MAIKCYNFGYLITYKPYSMDFLWNFLVDRGIDIEQLNTIRYLYMLLIMTPVVATVIGIARYIIGLRSLTFYIPLLITFIFFELGDNGFGKQDILRGLSYGFILFLIVFLVSTFIYKLLKGFRMHYIPKLSLIIIGASLTTVAILLTSVLFDRTFLLAINPFALIIMAISTEGFMSVYAKKNFKYTVSIAFETLLISVISYLLISWSWLQNLIVSTPLVILILILINVYVGRYLGLRLTEYSRFRNILIEGSNDAENNSTSKK